MTERERFEAWYETAESGSIFFGKTIPEQMGIVWQAALAASAPKVEMTDAEIVAVWQSMPGGPEGWLKSFGFLQFARAIAARSAPNAELVAALKECVAIMASNGIDECDAYEVACEVLERASP